MGLFRKEEDPYHVLKPNDMKNIEEQNVEAEEELEEDNKNTCNFETIDKCCLLKSNKGKCDDEECLLWKIWMET